MKNRGAYQSLFAFSIVALINLCPCAFSITQDMEAKTVLISDEAGALQVQLRYAGQCFLDSVRIRGREVIAPATGVCSAIKIGGEWFTTRSEIPSPIVTVEKNHVRVENIQFGNEANRITETWWFTENADHILWKIQRRYTRETTMEDMYLPGWDFADMQTWTGALLDTGGVAWCKLMQEPNASYGVHAASATFWNPSKNDALRIETQLPAGAHAAVRFSHQPSGLFSFNHSITTSELQPKHDLRRFLNNKQDVWAAAHIQPGEITVSYVLSAPKYSEVYPRNDLKNMDSEAVQEICNTIGRIGVIDQGIMGSNGWYSGYAVLHEPWLAQMGLAINDSSFTANYARTLDHQRDHAIGPDGRVKSRWAHNAADAIPGTYDASGYYEAQWGILFDSQPSYVINVAEQFDFTGDLDWVRGHKTACEKVLALALNRDVNANGLLECMNDSHTEAKGSDWIDVVWAAFENGFVNAQMYQALSLWSDVEEVLEDPVRAESYRVAAARLKTQFNAPVAEGGLWLPDRGWYAYWRDKDGAVHGDNFVVPVNLMAIAYGLCDNLDRKTAILDHLETVMCKENLFFWPLCLYSYQREEVYKVNWPFPAYENGDLFLAWGEIGARAYAGYKPEIALKYIRNVLQKYRQDGLAYQRYLRADQNGAGDDILANNLQPVTGLFRNIYGIQPKYNRLYLEPHCTPELYGTVLNYTLRGQRYQIGLAENLSIAANGFTLDQRGPFGMSIAGNTLEFFPGNAPKCALSVMRPTNDRVEVSIDSWPTPRKWTIKPGVRPVDLVFTIYDLTPAQEYTLSTPGEPPLRIQADTQGTIQCTLTSNATEQKTFSLE